MTTPVWGRSWTPSPLSARTCPQAGGIGSCTAARAARTASSSDWAAHGRDAGWIRNLNLTDAADVYIEVWDGSSTGTLHATGLALQRRIPWQCRIVQPRLPNLPAHAQPWDETDTPAAVAAA